MLSALIAPASRAQNCFRKGERLQATKADVDRCLQRIDDESTGRTDHAMKTRENILQLRIILDNEVATAGDQVEIAGWLRRLRLIAEIPWRKDVEK